MGMLLHRHFVEEVSNKEKVVVETTATTEPKKVRKPKQK